MSAKRRDEPSAVGDAEIIISPDGEVMIFRLNRELLKAAEALNPTDLRAQVAREALEAAKRDDRD